MFVHLVKEPTGYLTVINRSVSTSFGNDAVTPGPHAGSVAGPAAYHGFVNEFSVAIPGVDGASAASPYSSTDSERWVPEEHKSSARTEFERDRARILHSSALRRLGEKTQVLGPISDDFVRTRLTHSLEVAQVGRELGKELGADPDVVDAACLSHDLGHPPFGHNGERALDAAAASIGGFEGNAQTLRVVTRLEPKVIGPGGVPAGLNLSRATLDAICQYPWVKSGGPDLAKSTRKFSVYPDDAPVFAWMRQGAPAGRRCLEAQIMDLSDDIAYSVHDMEDAVATRKLDPADLFDDEHCAAVVASTLDWYGPAVARSDLEDALERIVHMSVWLRSFDGSYASLARLKDATSELIGRFCSATVAATRETFGDEPLGRYRADLVVPRQVRAEIQILKGMAVHYVMSPRDRARLLPAAHAPGRPRRRPVRGRGRRPGAGVRRAGAGSIGRRGAPARRHRSGRGAH